MLKPHSLWQGRAPSSWSKCPFDVNRPVLVSFLSGYSTLPSDLKLVINPERNLGSFQVRMAFRNRNLGNKHVHASVLLLFPEF